MLFTDLQLPSPNTRSPSCCFSLLPCCRQLPTIALQPQITKSKQSCAFFSDLWGSGLILKKPTMQISSMAFHEQNVKIQPPSTVTRIATCGLEFLVVASCASTCLQCLSCANLVTYMQSHPGHSTHVLPCTIYPYWCHRVDLVHLGHVNLLVQSACHVSPSWSQALIACRLVGTKGESPPIFLQWSRNHIYSVFSRKDLLILLLEIWVWS